MSIAQVRFFRQVPAKVGMRVRYHGRRGGSPVLGTIRSARHGYLNILLDDLQHAIPFHPTWELEYLGPNGEVLLDTRPCRALVSTEQSYAVRAVGFIHLALLDRVPPAYDDFARRRFLRHALLRFAAAARGRR